MHEKIHKTIGWILKTINYQPIEDTEQQQLKTKNAKQPKKLRKRKGKREKGEKINKRLVILYDAENMPIQLYFKITKEIIINKFSEEYFNNSYKFSAYQKSVEFFVNSSWNTLIEVEYVPRGKNKADDALLKKVKEEDDCVMITSDYLLEEQCRNINPTALILSQKKINDYLLEKIASSKNNIKKEKTILDVLSTTKITLEKEQRRNNGSIGNILIKNKYKNVLKREDWFKELSNCTQLKKFTSAKAHNHIITNTKYLMDMESFNKNIIKGIRKFQLIGVFNYLVNDFDKHLIESGIQENEYLYSILNPLGLRMIKDTAGIILIKNNQKNPKGTWNYKWLPQENCSKEINELPSFNNWANKLKKVN